MGIFHRKVKVEVTDEQKVLKDRQKRIQEKWKTDRAWRGLNHQRFLRVRAPDEIDDHKTIYCLSKPHRVPKPR